MNGKHNKCMVIPAAVIHVAGLGWGRIASNAGVVCGGPVWATAVQCGLYTLRLPSQVYSVRGMPLCLTGTAEVPLGAVYMDQIVSEEQLPIRLAAFGHCFRTEAGSAGASADPVIAPQCAPSFLWLATLMDTVHSWWIVGCCCSLWAALPNTIRSGRRSRSVSHAWRRMLQGLQAAGSTGCINSAKWRCL